MSWLRVLAVAALSVLFPGAGHALLREWLRAVLFAALFLTTVVLFTPIETMAAASSTAEMAEVATEEINTLTRFTLSFIVVFAAVDASFRALNLSPTDRGADGETCPECGRSIDEDLEFCHWCTARLEPTPAEEA